MKRRLLLAFFSLFITGFFSPAPSFAAESLQLLQPEYPRAFFFRASESLAARPMPFTQYDRIFGRLDGIMGKALDEEIPTRSKTNIEVFTKFKQAHPDKAVLLHFNGNARDPRFHGDRYFAGHWLYYNGCRLTEDLPAARGESIIHVQNPQLFRVNMGRFGNSSEDLAICRMSGGKPDWNRCEQLQLVAVDAAAKTITVRRAAFGTQPLEFPKGSYIAAHASEGPWGGGCNLLWFYNFSSTCPRDARGRTCADVLAAEMGEFFAPGGPLAAFDGISLDVSQFDRSSRSPRAGRGGRGIDADGDGRLDDGIVGGLNVYGIGQTAFHAALRRALGDKKIILADGMSWRNQRSFGSLNGIESEGFPTLNDWAMADWSGGLNRHFAWRAGARTPTLNYLNHKYIQGGEGHKPDVPFSTHRLAFAAAVFTDSAICFSFQPPGEPGDQVPIWDELIAGAEARLHWLGRPQGEAIRLGRRAPDLLLLPGKPDVKIAGANNADNQVSATLATLDIPAGDLLVLMNLRGEPRQGYARETPRLAMLTLQSGGKPLAKVNPSSVGAWVTENNLEAGFYFRNAGPAKAELVLSVEGREPVYVTGLSAHNAPDAMARRFEHGLVLANPSTRPFTFNLAGLARGAKLRRLQGTPRQDPQTNNGAPVGNEITLPAMDALFLMDQGK